MKIFWLDPVWRGERAMLTSFSPGTNPRPPTIATIAPVFVFERGHRRVEPLLRVGEEVAGLLGHLLEAGDQRRVDLQAAAVQRRLALLERVAEDRRRD